MLQIKNIYKQYRTGDLVQKALDGVSLNLRDNEFVAILGPSGSCLLYTSGQACPDHIHMLLEIPPKYSISEFMGQLKSKSTLMIFDRHANLKYKFGNRHFWAKGYFVDTVGKNEKRIREYIQNQLQEDKLYDQMSLKEFIDPFTGEPVERGKKKKPF